MIPGYNQKRPQKEHYQRFEKELVSGLEKLGLEGVSLLIYGSYIRGDYVPGRSDIDAVLIFDDDVVINKENVAN